MNIFEGIGKNVTKFVKGGLDALKDAEPAKAVVVNVNQEGRQAANILPVITPIVQPNVYTPQNYIDYIVPEIEPVQFDVTFVPIDYATFEYLDPEQLVVVFVFNAYEPERNIFLITELGQGISNGELYPGRYGLIALVLNEDFEDIGYVEDIESVEDIDGVGIADFIIDEYQPSFDLHIPISTDDYIISGLLGIETTIIGNRRSHVYHFSNCPGVYQMSMDNRVIFPSQEAAEDDGYKPCEQCIDNRFY